MTLYTTHRPQQFKDLIGQSTPSRLLQQALIKDKTVNSYIFTGPRGTGKTSSARIFARALTCENPIIDKEKNSYEPCNKCASCLSILNFSSTDYIEIDGASNRGIEDSRNIKENAQYHPIQLKKKIFVIDEVHMLTTEAFNALLKTLEEPPPHAVFILATTEFEKIPLTVRSRCQLVRFLPGEEPDIQQKLDSIVKKEKLTVEPGVTAIIAKHAKGGYRDAETILESLNTQRKELTVDFVNEKLGVVEETLFNKIFTAVITGDYPLLREELPLLPQETSFYERIIYRLIERVRLELVNKAIDHTDSTKALNQLLEAYLLTKSAPIPSLPLEIACLNMSQTESASYTITNQDIPKEKNGETRVNKSQDPITKEATNSPKVKVENTVTIKSEEAIQNNPIKIIPTTTDKVPVVEIGESTKQTDLNEPLPDIRKIWKDMIHDLSVNNPALSQLLKEATIHSYNSGAITLNIRFSFHADKIKEKKTQTIIQKILKEKTGRAWELEYVINKSTPRPTMHKKLESGIDSQPNQNQTSSASIIQDVSNIFGISS